MAVKPIPEGYRAVTPYLVVEGAAKLIDFLSQAFGAHETHERMTGPDGRVMHAEVKVGDSLIMIGEPMGKYPAMPAALYLYVTDADKTYQRALSAGGMSLSEPADQFYGDRSAGIKDPCGNMWWIATHKEDVSREELVQRATKLFQRAAG